MVTEQDKTLDAIKMAIQMEIDGKEFYLQASHESSNTLGTELLQSLAAAEDHHRQKFVEIYEAIRNKKGWPIIILPLDSGKELRTVFTRATKEIGSKLKVLVSELDVVQTAIALEIKTYEFYRNQGEEANYDAERDFYLSLVTEEREHHLLLLDYYEYLKDPAGYFVKTEHPSLDGG